MSVKSGLNPALIAWLVKIMPREGRQIGVKTPRGMDLGDACDCLSDYDDGSYALHFIEVDDSPYGVCHEVMHLPCETLLGWRKGDEFYPV